MIDGVADLKLQHLVELSKLGDGCCALEEEIEGWLVEHDVVFGGHTIPFVLMPHFISPAQLKAVRRAVGSLSAVLDRLCDAYPDDAALREQLAVPDAEDELIRIDPGYPRPLRVCRLDAFLSGGDVKFLEFNADSPAGIGYTDNLYEGLRRAIDLPRVRGEFETSYTPMLPVLISTLLDAYRHFRAGSPGMPEHPRLALVDVGGSPSVPEFRITCAAAAEAGLEALHCTLDDLSYDGSALHAGGEPVQLVYRRALLEEVGEGPLVDAARDRRVCLVNPFRARVANNKKLFALLDDPRYADRDELEVIRRTIPWTRVLREGPSKYGEWVVDLLAFTSDNRERLVLKPASDYGGHGVALGMETEQAAWDALIEQHGPSADFVVQEYVPVPQEMFPTVEGGHIQMQLKHFNINPFGIGGRYAGMITRISDRAVINVSAGGGLLPSVLGEGEVEMLKRGYDVDENAIRFSNYFHVLRELVHLSCGWLALEPSFERKYGLGDHLHDDARAVTKIKRRLYELRHPSDYPGAPGSELSELLDELEAAASPGEYIHLAYGVAKPTLAAAIRIHLSELDPVTDEPSLRLLRQILARQERHAQQGGQVLQSNIGDVALQDLTPDVGALPIELRGEPRTLRILPPLGDPARDEFVEVTEGGDPYLTDDLYVNGEENHVPTDPEEQRHFFHGLMDAELCAAELMARNSHEHPEMPWDFHVDMARQTWDELRHARVHEILMRTELGCRWGDYPVGFSYFRSIYAYDLLARLVLFNGTSEQKAMWRHSHRRKVLVELGQENVAKVFDYLLADEVPHVHNGVRWGTYLLGGDERAYREKVRELRQGLDRTGAPAGG